MKKIIGLIAVLFIICSSLAYAGGDQNHGSKGQGSTGPDDSNDTATASQNRGG